MKLLKEKKSKFSKKNQNFGKSKNIGKQNENFFLFKKAENFGSPKF